MGFLDKLLGREPGQQQRPQQAPSGQWGAGVPAGQPAPTGQPYAVPAPHGGASTEDERAIARYKYLLRTAPPEDIERVHTEAFATLTPEQRQLVLQRLNEDLPASERPRSDQPADLARSATRAEMNRPGYLQGAFGSARPGGGLGMGGMIAGSMLGTIAGVVVGSALADMMLGGYESSPEAQEAGDAGADGGDPGADGGDPGGDAGGDAGGQDFASGDAGGGDFGGFGGDFGGGDFGGDFGGGDFGF
jgi:hypothetical protein